MSVSYLVDHAHEGLHVVFFDQNLLTKEGCAKKGAGRLRGRFQQVCFLPWSSPKSTRIGLVLGRDACQHVSVVSCRSLRPQASFPNPTPGAYPWRVRRPQVCSYVFLLSSKEHLVT